MKTSAWILSAGLAIGAAAALAPSTRAASFDDKADLTPRYKAGQVITFKQHTVRKDTMTITNMPAAEKPADAGKDAPKPDAPKSDAPKSDAPKSDAPKAEAPKADAPKSDPAKTDPSKADTAKTDQPKTDPPKAEPAKSAPMKSSTSYDQTATYELKVTEASEQSVSIDMQLKSVVCTAELGSGKFTWNSDTPEDDKDAKNPVLVSFRPIVGAVLKIKIGPDGNITSIDADPAVNMTGRSPLAPMIQQLASADGVRLRFGSVLWIKDGREPATIGKPWTNSEDLFFAAVGKFTHVTNNTLKSVKDDLAQIDITGEVKLAGMEPGKPPAGTLKDQSLKGSCVWDVKNGLAKSHTWEQRTVMELKAAGAFDVIRESEFTVTTTRE